MWNQIWGGWKYSALKFRNSIEKWAPRCCWQWGGIQEDTWHFHPFKYEWVHILSNQSAFLDGALNAEWIIWELTKCRSLIAKSGYYEQSQNSKSFGLTFRFLSLAKYLHKNRMIGLNVKKVQKCSSRVYSTWRPLFSQPIYTFSQPIYTFSQPIYTFQLTVALFYMEKIFIQESKFWTSGSEDPDNF